MICSAAETAMASVGRARMMSRAETGDKCARRVLSVLDDFDAALSANLICNNIFNIGCATSATVLAMSIGGDGAVTAATALTTVIVFFAAEILPKRFAKDCPELASEVTAPFLLFVVRVLSPFVAAFTALTNALSRLLFGKPQPPVTYTENEVETLIDTVADETDLPPEHGNLIRSAYELTVVLISDIETSWKNTSKLPADADRDAVMAIARSVQHTRFPVVLDGVPIGVLHIRQYIRQLITDGSSDIRSIMTPPYFISGDMPADEALSEMSRQKTSLAFVRRNSGEISGIVTVEDILERLVGDMDDETDTEDNV